MIFKTCILYNLLCEQCFSSLLPMSKWRKDFFKDVLWLFLSIYGRVNFLQLGRYGRHCEQRYRQQFEKSFNFMSFNSAMVKQHCSDHKVIAFDPSYISKSGKSTPGVGYFWSGCAGNSKWGLEIGGIAAIDLENHTAMHLEAVQTIPEQETTLLDHYAKVLTDRAADLLEISDIVVCDAYFSKKSFVSSLCDANLQVVSRFRNDVRLKYVIPKVKTGKRGRPKEFDGLVDFHDLNMKHFEPVGQGNENRRVYTAILRAVALKRNVKVVIVQQIKNNEIVGHKVYFSTKIELDAIEILDVYQTRFQIEFLYRDAKQHTALNSSQARDKEKLNFHFNMSLTAVNIAKVVHWFSIPKDERREFSLSDIKTINHNTLLLDRFISTFAIRTNKTINNQNIKELLLYGTKAA
jgi:hypothetical protein